MWGSHPGFCVLELCSWGVLLFVCFIYLMSHFASFIQTCLVALFYTLVSLVSFLAFLLCRFIFITACMSHADNIQAPAAVADRLTFFCMFCFQNPNQKPVILRKRRQRIKIEVNWELFYHRSAHFVPPFSHLTGRNWVFFSPPS